MKITEDVRKFAAEQKVSEHEALQIGLEQEAREFARRCGDLVEGLTASAGKSTFLSQVLCPSAL
jgi:hypothetical protein